MKYQRYQAAKGFNKLGFDASYQYYLIRIINKCKIKNLLAISSIFASNTGLVTVLAGKYVL